MKSDMPRASTHALLRRIARPDARAYARTDGRTEKDGRITHVRHKTPVSERARKTGISSKDER